VRRTKIGRFWQVDPLSEKYVHNSVYAFSENKVTNHVELEGLEAVSAQKAHAIQKAKDGHGAYIHRAYSVKLTNSKMTAEQLYNSIGSNFSQYTAGVSYFEKVRGQQNSLAVGDEFAVTGGPNYHTTPVSKIRENFPNSADMLLGAQKDFVDESSGTYHWGDIHTGVSVVDTKVDPNKSYSFTLATWEGHVEAGLISFTATQGENGSVMFNINSTSKSSNFGTDFAYKNLGGRNSQTKHWETFLQNLIRLAGSKNKKTAQATTTTED
jgi:hypothetical protein